MRTLFISLNGCIGAKMRRGTSTLMAAVHCARLGVLPAAHHAHPAYYVYCVLLALISYVYTQKRRPLHVQQFLCLRRTRLRSMHFPRTASPFLLIVNVGLLST